MSDDYKQAMKDVINLLMIQHEAAKGTHNYWHVAANLVRAEFLQDSDTSEKRVQKSDKNEHEWVGLTDEERYLGDARSEEEIEYARAIEAKLKEKNN